MAPDILYDTTDIPLTKMVFTGTESFAGYQVIYIEKKEPKVDRIKRIAKEKMYASWDLHNKKTHKIVEVKQICKPRHKVNHMGRRF